MKPMETSSLPLVSICLPFKNEEDFLKGRLRNILQFKYPNLELIFSDNCSNDRSAEILKNEDLSQIPYLSIRQSLEITPESNWEACLQQSKGKYVMFAAADDYHDDNFIAEGVRFLEKNPDFDVWMPQVRFIDYQDKPYQRPAKDSIILPIQKMSFSQKVMYCVDGNINFMPYALFRGEQLRAMPVADLMSSPSFEQPFLLHVFCTKKIWINPKALFTYRLKINITETQDSSRRVAIRYGADRRFPPYHVLPAIHTLLQWVDRIYANDPGRLLWVKFWVLVGILRSGNCSKEWYGRIKTTLWTDLLACLSEKNWRDVALLSLFIPLKIKPFRWLISQHRNYAKAFQSAGLQKTEDNEGGL
jgi:glycosyltransferase involved in cell wall biosynthesis